MISIDILAPCKKQRYLGRREREKYLGRREKGVKKFREKGDGNFGDMGPFLAFMNGKIVHLQSFCCTI